MQALIERLIELVERLYQEVLYLPERIRIKANQIVVTTLSEVSERLGLIRAGEFRSGNNNEPGDGFTGVRIGYPPFNYADDEWNIVSVNNDDLEVGFNTDGKAYFAGGDATLDSTGLNLNRLNYAFRQTATNAGNTRVGKVTMTTLSGGSIPVLSIEFSSESGSNLITNGGFETGDFSNWTKTIEERGSWSVVASPLYAGSYAVKWTPTYGGSLGVLTSDQFAVSSSTYYIVQVALYNQAAVNNGYGIAHVHWYDSASGGNWLSTDTIGEMNFSSTSWSFFETTFESPASAAGAIVEIAIGDVTDE